MGGDDAQARGLCPLPSRPVTGTDPLSQDFGFVEQGDLNRWLWLLEKTKQVVVAGRPNTGKKHLAKRLAQQLTRGNADEECVKFVRLHPNLCYEDFVQGFRPVEGSFELQVAPSSSASPVGVHQRPRLGAS